MSTVYANGRSIVHQGDGKTNTAAPPDACKTPTPGGPVPIPYVNVAMNSDLAAGTLSVRIEGHPVAKADSNLSTSSGDEAGTAGGGLLSAKTKGKLTWATSSSDVLFEGKGVVRFLDVTQHNGNSYNTAFTEQGGTGLAYGDDFEGPCPACGKDAADHRIHETVDTAEKEGVATIAIKVLNALRAEPTPYGRSCMVAVARCKCGKVFVAASGNKRLNAFMDKVNASGCGATDVLGADAGSPGAADALVGGGKPILPAARDQLRIAWSAMDWSFDNPRPAGYTNPGQCAAQKVFATGHVITEMSEVWYQAPKDDPGKFMYTIQATLAGKGPIPMDYESVKDEAAKRDKPIGVASCKTCQVLLPLMLCKCDPERTC
jgi:hypothetical protein